MASSTSTDSLQCTSDSISASFLSDFHNISATTMDRGTKKFMSSFLDEIKVFEPRDASNIVHVTAKCFHSMKKMADPHTLYINIAVDKITDAYWSRKAGLCLLAKLSTAMSQWRSSVSFQASSVSTTLFCPRIDPPAKPFTDPFCSGFLDPDPSFVSRPLSIACPSSYVCSLCPPVYDLCLIIVKVPRCCLLDLLVEIFVASVVACSTWLPAPPCRQTLGFSAPLVHCSTVLCLTTSS
ncbi:uncharacterized protein LOC116734629 [Xiphophorus hellerii]|uniref:uncharacterized protein LOC116734629 n=1 Tax=Xiphophorus hellerii TaxID=8084 RepID=UPI0013B42AF2|nr:uncharacterized protein LOC116734629 [Xiphophorus hellerii]